MTANAFGALAIVNILDARSLLTAFGVAGIFVALFAETGLLVGFFLPGDSLLFTAGLLSSSAVAAPLPLPWVLVASVAGALLGAQVGFLIGRRAGPALTDRARRPRIAAGIVRSRRLLDRYGQRRAIVLARFIPVVRTVLNPLAGALGVPARTFTFWQAAGGVVWTVGLVVAGFLLGRSVPGIDQYLLPVVGLIVAVSLVPLAVELLRARRGGGLPRVIVVDHDSTRRTALADLLTGAPDVDLVGTASNVLVIRAMLDAFGADRANVVLVALHPPDGADVTSATAALVRLPGVRVWAYTDDPEGPAAAQALGAGAVGVLTERTLLDDLRNALR